MEKEMEKKVMEKKEMEKKMEKEKEMEKEEKEMEKKMEKKEMEEMEKVKSILLDKTRSDFDSKMLVILYLEKIDIICLCCMYLHLLSMNLK